MCLVWARPQNLKLDGTSKAEKKWVTHWHWMHMQKPCRWLTVADILSMGVCKGIQQFSRSISRQVCGVLWHPQWFQWTCALRVVNSKLAKYPFCSYFDSLVRHLTTKFQTVFLINVLSILSNPIISCSWRSAERENIHSIANTFFPYRVKITFMESESEQTVVEAEVGQSVLDAAHANDIDLEGV